jgi:hypothetical protein
MRNEDEYARLMVTLKVSAAAFDQLMCRLETFRIKVLALYRSCEPIQEEKISQLMERRLINFVMLMCLGTMVVLLAGWKDFACLELDATATKLKGAK